MLGTSLVGFIFDLGKNALKIELKQNLAYNDKLETGKTNIRLKPLEASLNLNYNVNIILTISLILAIVNKKVLNSYLDILGLSVFIPLVVALFVLINFKLNSYIKGSNLKFN